MLLAIYAALSLICIIACYKLGDWKNWRLYYPTILFFMFGEIFFDVLVYESHLWCYYAPGMSDKLLDLIWVFAIFPSTVLIYLYRMPEKLPGKVLYIALWIALYVGIELLLHYTGHMIYCNGWGIHWSILLDTVVFIALYLHHKKPLLGWAVSSPFFIAVLFIFGINPFKCQ